LFSKVHFITLIPLVFIGKIAKSNYGVNMGAYESCITIKFSCPGVQGMSGELLETFN